MPWFALAALFIYLTLAGLACTAKRASNSSPRLGVEAIALTLGLLLHGTALFTPFTQPGPFHFGTAEALSLIAWLALAIYLAGQVVWRLHAPLTMLIALATGLLLISIILPSGPALSYTLTPLARTHLLLAMLAYGMLTNAVAVALLMRFAEQRLHHPRINMLQHTLPPLLTLEKLLFLCLWLGFILLTLTLASGTIFAEQVWGHPLTFSHKTLFSALAWLAFGSLLLGRIVLGWRGRFAANWTLAGYALLILGYIGTRLVIEFILHRI